MVVVTGVSELNYFQQSCDFVSYFHKELMWRGVKVEKSRKNGFSYDKAIFFAKFI